MSQKYLITGSPIHRIREHGSWWVTAKPERFTELAREMTVPSEDVALSKKPRHAAKAWQSTWKPTEE